MTNKQSEIRLADLRSQSAIREEQPVGHMVEKDDGVKVESSIVKVSYNVIAKNSSTLSKKKSRATSTSSSSRRTCDNVH